MSEETSWDNQNISIMINKNIWQAILYTFKTEGFWVIRNVMSHFIYIWKIVLSQPKYLSTSMVTSKRSSDWKFPGVWFSIWHEPLLISQFRAKRPQRLKIASRVTECLQFTHWNAWVCNLTWSSIKCNIASQPHDILAGMKLDPGLCLVVLLSPKRQKKYQNMKYEMAHISFYSNTFS